MASKPTDPPFATPAGPSQAHGQTPAITTLDYESRPKGVFTVGTLVYTMSGLVLLFSWLLWGDFALSMRDRSVGPLTEKFLLKYGASNTLKQVLSAFIPTLITLIVSPIVSYRSDRLRSRWGRRIPFLIIPTPIAGLAMVAIAYSPYMGEWLYRVSGNPTGPGIDIAQAAGGYTIAVFAVFWTIFEVAVITSTSVFGGLINDVVPRSVLGRFHGLFRAVSLYDGIFFNAILFQFASSHFTLMFAMIGLFFGAGFTLMCLKVKEGEYPPVPADPTTSPRGFPIGPDAGAGELIARDPAAGLFGPLIRFWRAAATYLKECFSHPYYIAMFLMFVIAGLTFSPINSFSIRYATQLKMADGDYGFLVAVSYLVSLTIAFPLGMMVDKVHAFRASVFTMGLYAITMLLGSLFVHDARSFGWAFIGHTILSGTYFTCSASLGQQLYPRAKFSQYASAGGILASVAGLFFAPSIGAALDLTKTPVAAATQPTYLYDYHMTFWFGLVLSLLSLGLMGWVYLRFNSFGGRAAYLAPGDTSDARTRPEPPRHMVQILIPYFIGAFCGIAAGYVLGFVVNLSSARAAGVGLGQFHTLLTQDSFAFGRNLTLLCLATGVIPGAVLGSIIGTKWAAAVERRETEHLA